MSQFASGKHAKGICDICGFTYKLTELRKMTGLQQQAGFYACSSCWTEDHPQLHVENLRLVTSEALRNPLPDARAEGLTNIWWGWNPVYALEASAQLGEVTVVVP